MEQILHYLGALGFILSLINFIISIYEKRTSLSVSDAYIYAVRRDSSERVMIFLTCTLHNHSSAPIAITGGSISIKKAQYPLAIDQTLLFGFGVKNAGAPEAAVVSTQLPISLLGKAANRCTLLCYCQHTDMSQLLPLSEELASHIRERLDHPDSEKRDALYVNSLPIALSLATTRRDPKFSFVAECGDPVVAYQKARASKWVSS